MTQVTQAEINDAAWAVCGTFRVVQFRKWANTVLTDYLVKDFAMDDARL